MIPAMLPPPTLLKVFEFAADVFEMRPALFATAMFVGKFIQFLVCALITIFYGPQLVHGLTGIAKRHAVLTWSVFGLLLVIVGIWFSRKAKESRSPRTDLRTDQSLSADEWPVSVGQLKKGKLYV
ncbi:hypothetical protein [Granulicella sp. dw_53]|uniref:hypothetical protein n=1 Tax=Granulicella sp. dw_53 TaxID=2719792 RepID=UPI001BD61BA6|nr:hypothetical protein [Granulicella sp. dw_53]